MPVGVAPRTPWSMAVAEEDLSLKLEPRVIIRRLDDKTDSNLNHRGPVYNHDVSGGGRSRRALLVDLP